MECLGILYRCQGRVTALGQKTGWTNGKARPANRQECLNQGGKAGLLVFPVIFLLWLHGICRSKLMRVPRENKMENWEAPRFKRNSVSRQKDMGNMEAGQVEYVTSTEIDNVSTFST